MFEVCHDSACEKAQQVEAFVTHARKHARMPKGWRWSLRPEPTVERKSTPQSCLLTFRSAGNDARVHIYTITNKFNFFNFHGEMFKEIATSGKISIQTLTLGFLLGFFWGGGLLSSVFETVSLCSPGCPGIY